MLKSYKIRITDRYQGKLYDGAGKKGKGATEAYDTGGRASVR